LLWQGANQAQVCAGHAALVGDLDNVGHFLPDFDGVFQIHASIRIAGMPITRVWHVVSTAGARVPVAVADSVREPGLPRVEQCADFLCVLPASEIHIAR